MHITRLTDTTYYRSVINLRERCIDFGARIQKSSAEWEQLKCVHMRTSSKYVIERSSCGGIQFCGLNNILALLCFKRGVYVESGFG